MASASERRAWATQLLLVGITSAVLLFLIPSLLSDFRLNLLGKLLSFAIIAIGIDLMWGYGGMLSLGQGVFFGLGAYSMAMFLKLQSSGGELPDFMTWSGLHALPWFWKPFEHAWFALPMAIVGPGLLAFVLGYVVFRSRVKGVYFSIITQALALILSTFFVSQQAYTGGTNGITNYTMIFGRFLIRPDTQLLLFRATVVFLMVTYLLVFALTRSRFGRLLVALRDDEDRMRSSGYNVALLKAVVFSISCAIAGLAGALFVPQVGIISPANLGIVPSIEMVVWVAIGGRGTLAGAVVGAVTVGLAKSYLSESFPEIWSYFLGGLFIGAVVLFPTGIIGTLLTAIERVRRYVGPRSEAGRQPEPVTAGPGVVSASD